MAAVVSGVTFQRYADLWTHPQGRAPLRYLLAMDAAQGMDCPNCPTCLKRMALYGGTPPHFVCRLCELVRLSA